MDMEQAYHPSINMILVEESSDDGAKLTIPESEIIEKFSQILLLLKGKTTISDESKPMPKMVTIEEFLRLEGQLENMQLVNEILWDRIRALEEKMAKLTSQKQSNMGIFGHSTSEEVPTPAHSQCVATNVTRKTKKEQRILTPLPLTLTELFQHLQRRGTMSPILANPVHKSWVAEMIAQGKYKRGIYCAYHSFEEGHFTEECWALKNKVEDLIERGGLIFVNTMSGQLMPVVVKSRGSLPSRTPLNTYTGKAANRFVAGYQLDGMIEQGISNSEPLHLPTFSPIPPGYTLNNYNESLIVTRKNAP
ncbi:hypothetical protein ACH5RR_008576 [Cinchona calisaya]|uniref:Uncharacterized protein n=1 Tax=Cinchona calisaya TaxID=153742 RepID=A0ABD3AC46_9GENT